MKLYLLDHRRRVDVEYYDTKLIGIFSSYSYTMEVIKRYSKLLGFQDFKNDFCITPIEIALKDKRIKKGMVYLLTITQKLGDDEITISYRLYSNLILARLVQVTKWLKLHRNNKIYLSKEVLNELDWKEGFVTME